MNQSPRPLYGSDFSQLPRTSIRTHITHVRQQRSPWSTSSKVAVTLLAVVIIVIAYSLMFGKDKEQDQSIQDKQVSNMIVSLYSDQNSHKLQHVLNLPAIPLVVTKSVECQKSKLDQLQQSIKNIKIFNMLRTKMPQNSYSLSSYFTPIKPLFAVQHHKFTSPSIHSQTSPFSFDYWNPFAQRRLLQYQGVNQIFEENNYKLWISSGRYLTFASHEPIKLSLLVLETPLGQHRDKDIVFIYGILAYDSILVNQNTLESVFIKKATLKPGINQIQCDEPACVHQYSMIMLVMDPIRILHIEAYALRLNYY